VQADTPVVVQFDRPVLPATVAGRVSVSPPIPGCELTAAFLRPLSTDCRAVWLSGDTAFVLQHPRAIFAPLKQYTFTVGAGVTSPDGTVNSVDHSWNLTSGSAPQVRSVTPSDGSRGVPVDTVVTVAFSGGMSATATDAAIRLDPAVLGTRVVRNSLDASRFVLFPGHLLRPQTRYRVTVASSAADQHHQPLLASVQASFSTGLLSTSGHAVVLAARGGEPATQVLLTALEPSDPGVPVPAVLALEAPRCTQPDGCGPVAVARPLLSYAAASLAPGGRWLAVVEQDLSLPSAAPTLRVLDLARGTTLAAFPGGTLPSWSPDGSTLAYALGNQVALYYPDAAVRRLLPAGDPLVAPAVWAQQGELMALEVGSLPNQTHVELGDAVVAARYTPPGIQATCAGPQFSPDGSELALSCGPLGAQATWILPLGAAAARPRLLDARLAPIGYAEGGILLGVIHPAGGGVRIVRVSVDSDDQVALSHEVRGLVPGSLVVSAPLRRFAFLAPGSQGVEQAFIESTDGSAAFPLTSLSTGLYATAVSLSG
jgi:Bacterial Ig-like domain